MPKRRQPPGESRVLAARATAGEVFLVGMDRQHIVRISRSIDKATLALHLHDIADTLTLEALADGDPS